MAKGLVSDTNLTAIANAIRTKNGSSDRYTPATMAQAISDIPTSQVDQETALQYMLNNKTDYTGVAAGLTTLTTLPTFTQPSGIQNFYSSFRGCSSLTSATIDISSGKSFQYMFADCSNLTTVNIGQTISGLIEPAHMFDGCSKLTTFPILDGVSGTDFSYVFSGCSKLTSMSIRFSSAVTTTMANLFYKCSNLEQVTISGSGSRVTNISQMFRGCSKLNLASVTLPGFSACQDCSYIFQDCKAITSVPNTIFSKIVNTGTTNIRGMCGGCTALQTFSATTNYTQSVTTFATMFSGCSNLTTVSKMNMSSVGNVGLVNMFKDCSSLSSTSLDNILSSLLTATSFAGTKTLKNIGLSSTQATTCTGLSNWAALSAAGWTTGY